MRLINLILMVITVLLGVSFAVLNADIVEVHYYVGSSSLPLSLLITLVLGVGLLMGLLMSGFKILRQKSEIMRLKSRVKLVEKEVENLRAIPLKDDH